MVLLKSNIVILEAKVGLETVTYIYPLHKETIAAKFKCRSFSESLATIPLKMISDHTARRSVTLQQEVMSMVLEMNHEYFLRVELIVSYGFDRSSGHSNFKQKFSENSTQTFTVSSRFATRMIPLRLITQLRHNL